MNRFSPAGSRFLLGALVAALALVSAGCGRTPPASFRLNLVESTKQRLTREQEQQVSTVLLAMFGTPDDPHALRHPSGLGPLLELLPESRPRRGPSPLHLDVRPEGGDSPLALLLDHGGRVLPQPARGLGWTVCADPSGNEVCLLGVAPPA